MWNGRRVIQCSYTMRTVRTIATSWILTVLVTAVFSKVVEKPLSESETSSTTSNLTDSAEASSTVESLSQSSEYEKKSEVLESDSTNFKNPIQTNVSFSSGHQQNSFESLTRDVPKNDFEQVTESNKIFSENLKESLKELADKNNETENNKDGTLDGGKPDAKVKAEETSAAEKSKPKLENPGEDDQKLFNVSSKEPRVTYRGVKLVRVALKNKEQRRLIKQMEEKGDIDIWVGNGTAVDILVKKSEVFDLISIKNLVYDVILDDLQRAIDEENPPLAEDEWNDLEGRKGHRMTWQMYHRMADIYGYLDYLTTTYPDMVSLETIGHSVEKKPLKVLKISSGKPDSKAIWVDSGIHAREWITPAAATYAISQMVENGDGAHGVDWYFLTLVNPDGYEHSHTTDRLWRKNRSNPHRGPCAGTDLNRNFGYRWGGQGSSQIPCRETYSGSKAFSEPETRAIKEFVSTKPGLFKAYVSLHSYGQYILYPWGYDRKVPPDYSDLHRVGRLMAQAMKDCGGQNYKVGSAAATLYPAAGGADDWAKGSAKIKYAYTIELRDTGRYGFVLPAQFIQPTAREAYAALKTLANEVVQL